MNYSFPDNCKTTPITAFFKGYLQQANDSVVSSTLAVPLRLHILRNQTSTSDEEVAMPVQTFTVDFRKESISELFVVCNIQTINQAIKLEMQCFYNINQTCIFWDKHNTALAYIPQLFSCSQPGALITLQRQSFIHIQACFLFSNHRVQTAHFASVTSLPHQVCHVHVPEVMTC